MWKNAGLRTRAHQGTRMARGEWATNFACRAFGCGVETICELSNMEERITGGNSFRQLCHSSVRCCF